ncbi:MAG TPA: DUF6189 family protein [Stackebrandtia sp.]|jgi:hypothetical protein|uniref:DUF6189 family protein n=1 Tax=Stackebrandtia sp. TaxID=2023065 RepID=UPI002D421930|nr:DUF6189 family protein [Stackebrandtia sp.]HZE38484.1 DUF6189 family protein [Stackebrandtia sp.]
MEIRELAELTGRVIDRVVPRLEARGSAARYAESIRGANRAGEWQIALESLVGVLADEGIAVTADDHRDLTRLFDHFARSRSADVRSRAELGRSDLDKVVVS